jgi:HEAT repeat protein
VLLQAAAEDDSTEALYVLVDMDLKGAAVEKELVDLWIGGHNASVAWILMKLDPKMTRPIAAALKIAKSDPDAARRQSALIKLGNLGPQAASAIPTVIQAAESDKALYVRSRACTVLPKLDPAGKQCTGVLIKGLSDPERDIRRNSFEALRTLGPAAKPALPALRKYAKTATAQSKRRAESLIKRLGG